VTLLTGFQTELGVLSGPGADKWDERANALLISAASSSRTSLKGRMMMWGISTGLPGKKSSSRAVLISSGEENPGSSGMRGGVGRRRISLLSRPSGGWL